MKGVELMQCPRGGGDMSSGVCEECGFPETVFRWKMKYIVSEAKSEESRRNS